MSRFNSHSQKDKYKKESKPNSFYQEFIKSTQSFNALPAPPLPLPAPINIQVDYDELKQPTDLSHYSSNSNNLYFPNLGWKGLSLFNMLVTSNNTSKLSSQLDSTKPSDKNSPWLFHPNDSNIKRTTIKYQPPQKIELPKEELFFERNLGKFEHMNIEDQCDLIDQSFDKVKKIQVGMRHPQDPKRKCVKVSSLLPNPWLPDNVLVKSTITPSNDIANTSSEPKHILPNNTLLVPRTQGIFRASSRLAALVPTDEIAPDGSNYKYFTEIEYEGPSTAIDSMSFNKKDLLLVENEEERIVYYNLMRKRKQCEQTDLYVNDKDLDTKRRRQLFGGLRVVRKLEEDF